MFKTKREYGDFPTLEEIRRDYFKLLDIIKDVKTIEQAKELDGSGKFSVEINGMSIDEFENGMRTVNGRSSFRGTNEDIEWIRYEAFGCLSYIYDRFDGAPMFDVWCNAGYTEFITDVRIEDITEENYSTWVKTEQNRIAPQQSSSQAIACNGVPIFDGYGGILTTDDAERLEEMWEKTENYNQSSNLNHTPNASLEEQIHSASVRAAESKPISNPKAKVPEPEL